MFDDEHANELQSLREGEERTFGHFFSNGTISSAGSIGDTASERSSKLGKKATKEVVGLFIQQCLLDPIFAPNSETTAIMGLLNLTDGDIVTVGVRAHDPTESGTLDVMSSNLNLHLLREGSF